MLNVTARPEEAVAVTANGASVTDLSASVPKVIVWFALTATDMDTVAVAFKGPSPVVEVRLVMATEPPAGVKVLPPTAAGPEPRLTVTASEVEPNGASVTDLSASVSNVIV